MSTGQVEEDVTPEGQRMFFDWVCYGKLVELGVFSNIFMSQVMGGVW